MYWRLDIETVTVNNKHYPYAIGYRLYKKGKYVTMKLFYLSDYNGSIQEASTSIMSDFLKHFLFDACGYHIYVHNLGDFDGYLLLKDLFKAVGSFTILMDKSKAIIAITLPNNQIYIRDSIRIFPASLKELCAIFKVPTPKGEFDHSRVILMLLIIRILNQRCLNILVRI